MHAPSSQITEIRMQVEVSLSARGVSDVEGSSLHHCRFSNASPPPALALDSREAAKGTHRLSYESYW